RRTRLRGRLRPDRDAGHEARSRRRSPVGAGPPVAVRVPVPVGGLARPPGAPFTLDLGRRSGSPAVTGLVVAVAVWLVTVLIAVLLDRREQAGPAETVLRRLTY